MEKYLLTIDQGTTGTKIQLFSRQKELKGEIYKKHTQYYPKPGWVEHDPLEIWTMIETGTRELMTMARIHASQVEAIGISNQGETVVAWNGITGETYGKAVVWSCKRSQDLADQWERDGNWNERIIEKTGLRIDPYFSATKMKWLLNELENTSDFSLQGFRVSTLESWLLWKLTGGQSYLTDSSTAARTLLYNIYEACWDQEILHYLGIKEKWLPQVVETVGDFGEASSEDFCGIQAPIVVSIVDQPAALYGHLCIEPGTSKCTYGTGCFTYLNIGNDVQKGSQTLLSTIVWNKGGKLTYAYDGPVFSAGSVLEWAKDTLNLFQAFEELQSWSADWYESLLLDQLDHSLLFLPALSGMGAPYWDAEARGTFSGFSHATNKKDIVRAILEGIAYMVSDVFSDMTAQTSHPITTLKVDGGLTKNPYLMQFQAELLNVPIEVPKSAETTSLGVAYLVGEVVGWWHPSEFEQEIVRVYHPQWTDTKRNELLEKWSNFVGRNIGQRV